MTTTSQRTQRAIFVGGAILFLLGMWFAVRVMPYMIDDAYIYFRYADNIAKGFGPTYNKGGAPVEGFTSPLWQIILAIGARFLGAAALPSIAAVLGLLAFTGCLFLLLRGGRLTAERSSAATVVSSLFPPSFWFLSTGAVFSAVSGLETMAFVLVVLAVHCALAGSTSRTLGIIAAGLALWTRPEGPWLAVAGVAQWLAEGSGRERARRIGLPMLVALGAGGVLLLAVRWSLFHDVLPNTYYAKRPLLAVGLHYVWSNSLSVIGLPLLAGAAGAIFGEARHRGYAAASIAWLAAAGLEGGDWMPGARFLQPALVLAALAAGGLARVLEPGRSRRVAIGTGLAVLPLLGLTALSGWERGNVVHAFSMERAAEGRSFIRWFQMTGARSIAAIDIGELGFSCPKVHIVDLDGLTDRHIGHSGQGMLRKRFDLSYVFDHWHPDVILIRIRRMPRRDTTGQLAPIPADSMSQPEGALLHDPRLLKDYRLVFVLAPSWPRDPLYGRAVYVRRGFVLPPGVKPATDIVYSRETIVRPKA